MSTVRKAVEIALEFHGEQKYGRFPYILHLIDVARLCQPFGETAEICGYLHDVLEDTYYPAGQLGTVFGRDVREVVEAITDPPNLSRKERKAAMYAKLAAIDVTMNSRLSLALIVKAADRLANVRACVEDKNESLLKMYRSEHDEFVKAVHRPYHGCVKLLQETTELLGLS
jgi:guanosine-3',5'-bis(diphosphate) 3'-pyrophosphohydrolase